MTKYLTEQQIVNKVAKFLRKQGKMSIDSSGESCAYLNPEGLRCAVGALIPKKTWQEYRKERFDLNDTSFDGMSITELSPLLKKYKVDISDDRITDLLLELQSAHDNCSEEHFVSHFNWNLKQVCKEWDLKYPKVKSK